MHYSSFFSQLRSAYQSEIDDLSLDSEGSYVLPQRLTEKRKQMAFLVQMMTLSPEMVAVVFHKAFEFTKPAVMDHLLTLESQEFPDWHTLSDAVRLQPWANELASAVLQDPMGDWFLTTAAGLEFMLTKQAAAELSRHDDDEDAYEDDGTDGPVIQLDADDAADTSDKRTREEAAADWMEEQGFDRKD